MGLRKIGESSLEKLLSKAALESDAGNMLGLGQWAPPSQPTTSADDMSSLPCETWLNGEERAIDCLFRSFSKLKFKRRGLSIGRNDDTDRAIQNISDFLGQMEHCINFFGVSVAPRDYRESFTEKYKNKGCLYSSDIIVASIRKLRTWKVNGTRYAFSVVAVEKAVELNQSLKSMAEFLEVWHAHAAPLVKACRRTMKAEFTTRLQGFDFAWAAFEEVYTQEWMKIEAEERQPLVDAVKCAQHLANLERSADTEDTCRNGVTLIDNVRYRSVQHSLVDYLVEIGKLMRKKGRSHLDAEIWNDAKVLCYDHEHVGCFACGVAKHLAASCVSMQKYLESMSTCMRSVDAELRKNSGLVQHLSALEEAQSMFEAYVRDDETHIALQSVFSDIRNAMAMVPLLRDVCARCDPELFMVLPRLVLLSLLRNPALAHCIVLRKLLPSWFQRLDESKKMQDALAKIRQVVGLLQSGQMPSTCKGYEIANIVAWSILIERAIVAETPDGLYDRISHSMRDSSRIIVEEFMLDLEGWSMELQRSCPSEWNRLSNILVKCLI